MSSFVAKSSLFPHYFMTNDAGIISEVIVFYYNVKNRVLRDVSANQTSKPMGEVAKTLGVVQKE